MLDPLLKELLSGDKNAKTKSDDRFQVAFDQAVQDEVEALIAEEPLNNELLDLELRSKKLEHSLRTDPSLIESKDHTTSAVRILLSEGSQFLENQEFETLYENITSLGKKLGDLDLHSIKQGDIPSLLKLPKSVCDDILKIGIHKYDQGLIDESLALIHFLTIVDSNDPDYSFRLGLLALQCQNDSLGLSAFARTSALAPEFIGAHIFAASCYIKLNAKEEALRSLAIAEKIAETSPVDEVWNTHMQEVKQLLNT